MNLMTELYGPRVGNTGALRGELGMLARSERGDVLKMWRPGPGSKRLVTLYAGGVLHRAQQPGAAMFQMAGTTLGYKLLIRIVHWSVVTTQTCMIGSVHPESRPRAGVAQLTPLAK